MVTYQPGGSFGELALIQQQPRRAAAVAREDLFIAILRKDDYLDTAGIEEKKKMDSVNAMYRNLPFIKEIFEKKESEEFFKRLYYAFEESTHSLGSAIYHEGEPAKFFFVIRTGQVKLLKNLVVPKPDSDFRVNSTLTYQKPVTILSKEDLCGEYEMLYNCDYLFTAVVDSEKASIFKLNRDKFYSTLFRSREYILAAKTIADKKYRRLIETYHKNLVVYKEMDPRTETPKQLAIVVHEGAGLNFRALKKRIHRDQVAPDPLEFVEQVNSKLQEMNEKFKKQ